MRTAGNIALAAAVAMMACGETPPCVVVFGPSGYWDWDSEWWVTIRPPDLDMLVGDTVKTSLADYFSPSECLESSAPADFWGLRSSNPEAVAVSVSAEHVLTTVAVGVADSVRVTVWPAYYEHPDDPDFEDYHQHFYVSVGARR